MAKLKNQIRTAYKYKDLLTELVSRDLKLKYRRSVLGYIWSVLNPLLVMIVMTIVFSSFFRTEISNFPVYLFTGNLLFTYMSNCTNMSMNAIIENAALLKKTYVPKYIFVLSRVASSMVDCMFSLAALVIVMIFTKSRFSLYNLLFPLVLLQLFVFCLGLSMFLAQACVFFRDIRYIYNAVTTAWMYLTPLFYPISMLPDDLAWLVKHLNPMYFYIGQFRDLIYSNRMPGMGIIIEGITAALLMLIIGIWSFKRNQDNFILYI